MHTYLRNDVRTLIHNRIVCFFSNSRGKNLPVSHVPFAGNSIQQIVAMAADSQNPISHRYVIQACHDLEGESAYACLASFLEQDGGERMLKEVLIRSLAVHIIALSAYGHLLSMQGVASAYHRQEKWRPAIMLLVFLLVPEVALVQFARRTCRGVLRWFRNRSSRQQPIDSWYCVSTSLGNYTSESCVEKKLVPLHTIHPRNLRYERKSYDFMWLGRLMVLLVLLVQGIGSLGIWYRSYSVYLDHWNTFMHFDIQNFRMVLGAFAVAVNSILITFTNLRWHHESTEEVNLSFNANDESPQSLVLPIGDLGDRSQCPLVTIQQKLQKYNDIFETRLDYLFPVKQQREIEAAMVVNTMAVLTKQLTPHYNPYLLCLHKFMVDNNTNGFELWNTRLDLPYEGVSLTSNGFTFNILPSVASTLILISFWNRYLVRNIWLERHLPWRIREFIVFCDKWLIGGRSVVAFAFFLVLAIYIIGWIPIIRLVWDVKFQAALSLTSSDGTHWDQLLIKSSRYKDSWYDNMYVL